MKKVLEKDNKLYLYNILEEAKPTTVPKHSY